MATKKYVSLEKLSLYDEKIKSLIATKDGETLDAAKSYADSLADNYDSAGSAATVQTNLETEIARAKAKEDEIAASVAENATSVNNLKKYVGTIPESASATDVVGYIDEKTSGIATDTALNELKDKVSAAEKDVATIKGDYLKAADKDELSAAIDAEKNRAIGVESELRTDVNAIKGDYLKAADKTELQGNIDTVTASLAAVKEEVDTFFLDADMTEAAKDTLKEIQEYINSDASAAAEMTASIQKNAKDITAVGERTTTLEGKMTAVESKSDENATAIATLQEAIGEGGSVDEKISAAVKTETDARVAAISEVQADADKGIADAASAMKTAQAADAKATSLNEAMDVRVKAVEAKSHEHANKELLDTYKQTEADLADAVAKKHNHANEAVLNGITAENVEAWNKVTSKADQSSLQAEIDRATAAEAANAAKIAEFVECSEVEIAALFN